MADNYPAAIAFALPHEGSAYVDDPDDPGGATRYGITLGTLEDFAHRYGLVHEGLNLDVNHDGHIDVRDIRQLTPAFATAFYREFIWLPLSLDKVADPKIAAKLLDEAINLGPTGIGKCVANALIANSVRGGASYAPITAATVVVVNAQDPARFLVWLKRALVANYQRIVELRPTSEKYLKGWIARANA